MLHERRVTHVLWVIWCTGLDVDIHFLNFARGKVNVSSNYVKLDQISKLKVSLPNMRILSSLASGFQNGIHFLCIRQLEIQKIALQKVTSSHLPFWGDSGGNAVGISCRPWREEANTPFFKILIKPHVSDVKSMTSGSSVNGF